LHDALPISILPLPLIVQLLPYSNQLIALFGQLSPKAQCFSLDGKMIFFQQSYHVAGCALVVEVGKGRLGASSFKTDQFMRLPTGFTYPHIGLMEEIKAV